MMEKYKIVKISSEEAFKIWNKSINSSVFNNPKFLNFYKGSKFFGAFKGEELYCCWPVIINEDKLVIPEFFYYLGPFWSYKFYEKKIHSRFSLSMDIYNCFIEKFLKIYTKIHFQTHYSLTDIRAFDWYNYGKSIEKRFCIKNKYTAIIENINLKNKDNFLSSFRYVRRYEIKNFDKLKKNISNTDFKSTEAVDLYLQTSNYNNFKDEETKKENILKLADIAKKGFGEICCFKEKKQTN